MPSLEIAIQSLIDEYAARANELWARHGDELDRRGNEARACELEDVVEDLHRLLKDK